MRKIIIALVLAASPALAQQQQPVDPALLHRAIAALQQQRNGALDAAAQAQAQASLQADEITRLKARVVELEKAAETAKPKE